MACQVSPLVALVIGTAWSCKWIVRGHWRQQWYPAHEEHRPKWILPYVKGPDDKTLKEQSRLFALVR